MNPCHVCFQKGALDGDNACQTSFKKGFLFDIRNQSAGNDAMRGARVEYGAMGLAPALCNAELHAHKKPEPLDREPPIKRFQVRSAKALNLNFQDRCEPVLR